MEKLFSLQTLKFILKSMVIPAKVYEAMPSQSDPLDRHRNTVLKKYLN